MSGLMRFAVRAVCAAGYFAAGVCAALFGDADRLNAAEAGAVPVSVERDGDAFRLLRRGEPYFVRGVGGTAALPLLAKLGANSVRTWSTDGLPAILDEAHRNGLTVCVGLWLGHERHGFDYTDEAAVLEQLESCLAAVRKFKDHPAVLMWGIGNEMEGEGTNPAVWYAVDHIAREIKRLDPKHPTMTVIAELGDHKLQSLQRFCPHIDIVGVNSYGGAASVGARFRAAGIDKPYILTEFGPLGPWEVGKTRWGAPREQTGEQKAETYRTAYRKSVVGQPGLCLGSYAFLWGHKQETTATWFGMLLPDGSRTPAADVMAELWSGRPPANRCPRIRSLKLDTADGLKPGEKVRAVVDAADPDGDPLTVRWVLRYDSVVIGVGGDAQAEELAIADAVRAEGMTATITVPEGGGGYRLFVYVRDGHGGADVANVPLFVDAPVRAIPSPRAKLPFVLYADGASGAPYVPSGYMGNTAAVKMTLDCREQPHSGTTCLRVEYRATGDWGGVLWQSPPQDWEGKQPGGLNLTGATELEFWARGAAGGEVVNFVVGAIDGDAAYRDTAKAELKGIKLTRAWQKYRIPLDGRDLSRIKTGFGWSLAGQGRPVTFYLDDIRYVAAD